MPGGMRVEGAEQLREVAAELRLVGEVELRKSMVRGLTTALRPAKTAVSRSMVERIPRSGGLNAEVRSSTKIKTSVRTTGRDVRAAVIAVGKHDIASLNRGRVRHPLFGNRDFWFNTALEPGFFDDPLEAMEPEVQAVLMEQVAMVERILAH